MLPSPPNVTEESLMNTSQHTNTSIVKCCCEKQCKGLRGLKAHQRSCRTLIGLQKDILEGIEYNQSENNDVSDIDIENQINSLPDVKAGVKLPKTDNCWNIANSYFKSTLLISSVDIEDLSATIKCMNETTCNYTHLQNKRMRLCGVPPPPPIILERLKLPQQIIYRRKENLSESPNHQKYWENILVSRFYEQFSRNRRNLGHFQKFKKISNS